MIAALSRGHAADPYGLDTRPVVAPYLATMPTVAPAGTWQAVPAYPNVTFPDLIGTLYAPGTNTQFTNRLLAYCRQGQIYAIDGSDTNTATKTTFLDLTATCQGFEDSGLLGMAFHPNFGNGATAGGYFYVWYSYKAPPAVLDTGTGRATGSPTITTRNRLARFTVQNNTVVADPASQLVLIDQDDLNVWHNGGGMFFHPVDGFLYLSLGDGGNGDGVNCQVIDRALFSGVIRIDVNMTGGSVSHAIPKQPLNGVTANYFIPNDNPWVGVPGVLEEFYALGLRSPHRMTHDATSNSIWVGDVGAGQREEVNRIIKGGNYQWAYKEAELNAGTAPATIIGTEQTPLYAYTHADGWAIIGGYVYRGTQFSAELGGTYLFGDNNGKIWSLTFAGGAPTAQLLCTLPGLASASYGNGLSGFGLDRNGELLICQLANNTGGGANEGRIYKLGLTPPGGAQLPLLLSQTGAFSNTAAMTPAAGVMPYNVNSPLWSDNALKSRWIAVPNDGAPYGAAEQITFTATGEWIFPNGTVFVKHFAIDTNDTATTTIKRLETRLLVRDATGGVYGATYKWRPDNLDADLLPGSLDENITITTATGTRQQTWYYPSRSDCLTCHNPNSGGVLGVKTRQQNGTCNYPVTGRTDNQLRTWNHIGLFTPAVDEALIASYDQLVPVGNTGSTLEHRVRSYLDANCSHCHRPGGVRANFDARFDTALALQNIINGPVHDTLGIAGAMEVVPRDTGRSIMYQRLNSVGTIKMPPLAKNTVDTTAVTTFAQWINGMALPPTVAITTPVAGTVTAPVTISATATDDGAVAGVAFFANGSKIADSVAGSSNTWTYTWNGAPPGIHDLTAIATDNVGASSVSGVVRITINPPGGGTVLREWWLGIAGGALADLTGNVNYPNTPTGNELIATFETPSNFADTYGQRLRGYVMPTVSGTYTFWIASDDDGRLLLSTDANPANATIIANVTGYTGIREWGKYPSQQSIAIALVSGQTYYIEALHAEGGGGDNLAVRWQRTGTTTNEPISGAHLLPFVPGATAPTAASGLIATAVSASRIDLSWADNAGNETGFLIERKLGVGGTYALIGTRIANITTFSDDGLTADTTYFYRVRAINGGLAATNSNEANATTLPTPVTPTAVATDSGGSKCGIGGLFALVSLLMLGLCAMGLARIRR